MMQNLLSRLLCVGLAAVFAFTTAIGCKEKTKTEKAKDIIEDVEEEAKETEKDIRKAI